jgi:hypothetical protein
MVSIKYQIVTKCLKSLRDSEEFPVNGIRLLNRLLNVLWLKVIGANAFVATRGPQPGESRYISLLGS